MKQFSVFLTLCTIMASSRAHPHNSTCEHKRLHCTGLLGEFCPQCDADGNFLPQQCWASTGHCWCVDIYSGMELPDTNTPPGVRPVECNDSSDYRHCPPGWTDFRDKCFLFVDTPKKWIEAEVYCQFDDANLVSIHDEEENRFIMSLTRGYTHIFPETWTGGFDAIHPGYWMWSDGSDFTYDNWYEHPYHNDDDDDEDDDMDDKKSPDDNDKYDARKDNCLRINYEYDLKWFHASCTESLPFVCSKKPH